MRVKHCGLLLLFYELLAKMVAIKIFRGFGRILFAMICSSRNVMFAMNYEEDICWPICLFVTHGLAVNRKMYIVIKSNSWINFMLEFLIYCVVFIFYDLVMPISQSQLCQLVYLIQYRRWSSSGCFCWVN